MMDRREYLVSLNVSFHSVLHLDNRSRSDCSKKWSFEEDIGRRHLVTSANRNDSECTIEEGKPFIYRRNRRGPRMLPWGTPDITVLAVITPRACARG